MQCMMKYNGNVGPGYADTVKKCKPGEVYGYEVVGDEVKIQLAKTCISIPEKVFSACFTPIFWDVRGVSIDGEATVLACGPKESTPDAKERKMFRLHGYKIYIDGKQYKD